MRHWINIVESAGSFPVRSFPYLLHVGSLNPSEKRNDSHEGHGLSVSLHPDEWRQITGGYTNGDLHKLTKPSNQFLDYHKMTKKQKEVIKSWGFDNGYLEPVVTYRVTYFDDEMDEKVYTDFEDRESAEYENQEIGGTITEIKDGFKITPKLAQLCRLSGNHYINVLDFAVIAYTEQVLNLDGIWWNDRLDPQNYSAPRGVIFPNKVASFSITKV